MWLLEQFREFKRNAKEFMLHLHPMLTVGLIAEFIEPLIIPEQVLFDGTGKPRISKAKAKFAKVACDLLAITAMGAVAYFTGNHWQENVMSYWFWVFMVCIGVCHDLAKRAKVKVDDWYLKK